MLILEGRSFKLHQEVGQILRKLLGDDKLNEMFIPRYTPHIIGEYSWKYRLYRFLITFSAKLLVSNIIIIICELAKLVVLFHSRARI